MCSLTFAIAKASVIVAACIATKYGKQPIRFKNQKLHRIGLQRFYDESCSINQERSSLVTLLVKSRN